MTTGLELQPAQCGSTALSTCQPRHSVGSGCYQVSQAHGEVIRAAWQQWEHRVATAKQWALRDSGKQAHGKHRSFQAITAQRNSNPFSLEHPSEICPYLKPFQARAGCQRGVFGVNPVALTSCSTRSAPLLPQWEKWENLSVEIKTI